MSSLKFTSDLQDCILIRQIALRAVSVLGDDGFYYRGEAVRHHMMNVSACHASGNPLRLNDLLAADEFNFTHDLIGIDLNICRESGVLLNHFRPRFSAPATVPA